MLNKVTLLGYVGSDPEIRSMPSGDRLASFSFATSESWKDKNTGERKKRTEWHRIRVWGNLVAIVEQYVTKGSKLYLEGCIRTSTYDKDGEKRFSTEIVLQGFGGILELLDSKGSSPRDTSSVPDSNEQDDEIPF